MARAVEISELEPEDLDDAMLFLRQQALAEGRDEESAQALSQRLRWFVSENPVRSQDTPSGWVARARDGSVAGALLTTPQRFRCRGRSYTLMIAGAFYVDEARRGLGLSLFQRYLRLGARFPLFSTTANDSSRRILEMGGAYAIPGTDHELLGVIHWKPVVEEWLQSRFHRPRLARAASLIGKVLPSRLARSAAPAELVALTSREDLANLAVEPPPELDAHLTAERDPTFLHWRYFEGPDSTRALFRFRGQQGGTGLVATSLRRRGHRGQVRALIVLDLWGRIAPGDTAAVAAALAERYRHEADVINVRGQPPEWERRLREAGFLRRDFPAATGYCIDRSAQLPTRDWYLVPADGDTTI